VVAQGTAEFGISVQEQVIPAREQDVPIVSIAAIVQHNTSSLMALARSGIERPADLAGHSYGGFGGALERELIETLVACDGGDPSQVQFVEVGDVDYLIGMDRGQYDFVWIFDGWDGIRATELEGEDVTFIRFIDYLHCIPDWYTPLIITSESMIANSPDVVSAFLAATTRGYAFAMENPAEAAQVLIDAVPELDPELVRLSAEFLAGQYVADPGRQWGLQDLDIWERFEAFLREAGLTEQAIDVEEAYTNEFLPGGGT
jgi:ABC-type nitrate/sulfonate/bicarbonate transport system substrate-binding protein